MPVERALRRSQCPHCGGSTGLRWFALLPSSARGRVFKCRSCGGGLDLSDISRMASIFGGLLGIGPGIFLLGRLVNGHPGSAFSVIAGTAMLLVAFGLGSIGLAWLTLRLVPKG